MVRLLELDKQTVFSINDCGNTTGFPILVNHGMIASITNDALFLPLLTAGFRVILLARPGYGASSPIHLQNVREWGTVMCRIVAELNLGEFDVLGSSSGAPYAYSTGFALPQKTRAIHIFSGTPALYDESVQKIWPYGLTPAARIEDLQKTAKELFFPSGVNSGNRDAVDSAQNDCFGPALDLKIRCADWGFKLQDLKTPVCMEHARHDSVVPYDAAVLTAKMLPDCSFTVRETGDHFSEEFFNDFLVRLAAHHKA